MEEDEDPESAIFQSAAVQPYHIALTGEPSSAPGLAEFLDAVGVGAIARDSWNGSGPIAAEAAGDDLINVLRQMRLDKYVARIRSASLEQMVEARDETAALLDLALTAAQFFRFMTPLPDAFGFAALNPTLIQLAGAPFGRDLMVGRFAALMLMIKAVIPGYDEALDLLLDSLPVLKAQVTLARSLPPAFRGANGMGKLLRLPRDESRRLIRDWAASHPADAQRAGVDMALL